MNAKYKKRIRGYLKSLTNPEAIITTAFDDPVLSDRRYQVMQYAGVVGDEQGRRYMLLVTGDTKWYLCYPLLGGQGVIVNGEGFPVKKSSLPKQLRLALRSGCTSSRMSGLACVMGEAQKAGRFSGDSQVQPRRAVITYGPEDRPVDAAWVRASIEEAKTLTPKPAFLIFASYEFADEATRFIRKNKVCDGMVLLPFLGSGKAKASAQAV